MRPNTSQEYCFAEGEIRDFNETEYCLDIPDNIRSAISAAEQLPMMASRRVVRITGVRVSTSANKDTLKEDASRYLPIILSGRRPRRWLFSSPMSSTATARSAAALKENSVAVDFPRLAGGELQKWVRDNLRSIGSEADDQTVRHLIDVTGDDLRRLMNKMKSFRPRPYPVS